MGGILAACIGALLSASVVQAPIGGGNALTLPAQRHLLRMDPGGGPAIWLLAVQQDGADGHGLEFLRSDDEAHTFRAMAPIQADWSERDTPDLVAVGNDVALTYSYEGPVLAGSTRHDVYFQWWRYDPGSRSFSPQPAVRVFNSTSSATAYSRAELARDSAGRLWIQAFKLESDGSSTAEIAVSEDGGGSWETLAPLDNVPRRGGGRLLWLGDRLVFVYAMHDGFRGTHFRIHRDGDPVGTWGPVTLAFSEGIYHGAALSAEATPGGGMDLVYKDENDERLYYRFFDGSAFGPRTQVDDSSDWALQPALTRVGDALYIFYNHFFSGTDYDFRYRRLDANGLSAPVVLDGQHNFKGYPNAAPTLPTTVNEVPAFFGATANAGVGGNLAEVFAPHDATPDDGGGDGGDGGADGGTGGGDPAPPPTSGRLFADAFNRNSNDSGALGSSWATTGLWFTRQQAITDLDGTDVAVETAARCADCQVSARMVAFGVAHAGMFLRAGNLAGGDRYQLDLLSNGHLQVQRIRGGTTTVLKDVANGVSDPYGWAQFSFTASGTSPVMLTATVNGSVKLSVSDSSSARITDAGYAGLHTTRAGVWWDDFALDGLADDGGSGGVPDAGVPDAGVPDAGVPDAGVPDSGVPDAGVPDAGVPDAGVPDAGVPDAGVPDAGVPDAGVPDAGVPDAGTPPPSGPLFTDAFNRNSNDGSALGPSWTTGGLWFTRQQAISDLDGNDVAVENVARCADCEVDARMVAFGVAHAGMFLRAQSLSGGDRYQLDLLSNGHLQVQRIRSGATTVLKDAPSGIADLTGWAQFSFTVSGDSPVTLSVAVNGAVKLTVSDSSTARVTDPGYAGLHTTRAGVWWDDFKLLGVDSGGGEESATDGGTGVGGGGTGGALTLSVVHTDTARQIMAVDPAGTAYALSLSDPTTLLASTDDARSWSTRGRASGATFWEMTALSSGTLLADVISGGAHAVARSSDHGATWSTVLSLGDYKTLTPHSWTELDGEVFLIEYQTFTEGSTTLRLWASGDDGRTWSVRQTFSGHRHGHGIVADPAGHALWVYFGDTDSQSGIYRSTDAGRSWTQRLSGQPGDVVDAVVLADGTLLFGQDISYLPPTPHVATLSPSGSYHELAALTGPSYGIHALRAGGFVIGAEREPGGDIYPASEVSAHLYTSPDGAQWTKALNYPRLSDGENARADVYWELPTGELLLELENIQGFGPGGKGYQVLRVSR